MARRRGLLRTPQVHAPRAQCTVPTAARKSPCRLASAFLSDSVSVYLFSLLPPSLSGFLSLKLQPKALAHAAPAFAPRLPSRLLLDPAVSGFSPLRANPQMSLQRKPLPLFDVASPAPCHITPFFLGGG